VTREWIEVRSLCDKDPVYIPGPCDHAGTTEPVESVLGEVIAQLCTQCDAQLPAEWR
jgi:hypothetical protein